MVEKRSPFTDQNTVLYQEPLYSWYTGERHLICRVYGNNELSFFICHIRHLMKYVVFMGTTNFLFSSVTWCCKKFKSGVDSVEDAPHARRPKTATSQKVVEKLTNLVATDARFTTRHIAKCVGISVGAVHTILRRDLKLRRISAR